MNLVFQVNIPNRHSLLKDDTPVSQPSHAQVSQSGFIEYAEWHDADYMFVEEAKLDVVLDDSWTETLFYGVGNKAV